MNQKIAVLAFVLLTIILPAQSSFSREASDYTDEELVSAGWSVMQIKELRGAAIPDGAEHMGSIHIDSYCGYFDSDSPGSIHPFIPEKRVESLIDEIMANAGLPRNFEVVAGGVSNAAALMDGSTRVIAYNQTFLFDLEQSTKSKWPAYSIMAHEIGHHLAGHALTKLGSRPPAELEADKFSGFAMQKLGASLKEAQLVMELYGSVSGSDTHPPRHDRLAAIAKRLVGRM